MFMLLSMHPAESWSVARGFARCRTAGPLTQLAVFAVQGLFPIGQNPRQLYSHPAASIAMLVDPLMQKCTDAGTRTQARCSRGRSSRPVSDPALKEAKVRGSLPRTEVLHARPSAVPFHLGADGVLQSLPRPERSLLDYASRTLLASLSQVQSCCACLAVCPHSRT